MCRTELGEEATKTRVKTDTAEPPLALLSDMNNKGAGGGGAGYRQADHEAVWSQPRGQDGGLAPTSRGSHLTSPPARSNSRRRLAARTGRSPIRVSISAHSPPPAICPTPRPPPPRYGFQASSNNEETIHQCYIVDELKIKNNTLLDPFVFVFPSWISVLCRAQHTGFIILTITVLERGRLSWKVCFWRYQQWTDCYVKEMN